MEPTLPSEPELQILVAASNLYYAEARYQAIAALHEEVHRECARVDDLLRDARQHRDAAQQDLNQAALGLGPGEHTEPTAAAALHVPVDSEAVDPRVVVWDRGER